MSFREGFFCLDPAETIIKLWWMILNFCSDIDVSQIVFGPLTLLVQIEPLDFYFDSYYASPWTVTQIFSKLRNPIYIQWSQETPEDGQHSSCRVKTQLIPDVPLDSLQSTRETLWSIHMCCLYTADRYRHDAEITIYKRCRRDETVGHASLQRV